jgi:signal transduction histidine kinase
MKIRYQLTFLFTTLVGSFLFLFCLAVYFFYSQFREREYFDRLRDKAIYSGEVWDLEEDPKDYFESMYEMGLTSLYNEEILIIKKWGKPEYESSPNLKVIDQQQFARILKRGDVRLRRGQTEIVGLVYKSKKKGDFVVVVAAEDRFGLSKLDTLFVILATGWTLSVFLMLFAGYFFAGNSLKPIAEIIKEVGDIEAINLGKRLKHRAGKDEISELSRTFNGLLARLEDAFKVQRNFVSNASHELRNPLASIKSQLDVTLLSKRNNEEYEAVLKSLLFDIDRTIKIANGLLQLAKLSGDAHHIKFEQCRVDEIILEAADSMVRYKQDYSFSIDYDQLPEHEQDLLVNGSRDLLFSAFYNVIENGCKYSQDHRVEIKISFSQYDIVIQVQDHGIGISQADRKRIFEPFYRSEVAREYGGIGLGLSLVQKIMLLHKGNITIHSEEGYGTLVTIRLNKRSVSF